MSFRRRSILLIGLLLLTGTSIGVLRLSVDKIRPPAGNTAKGSQDGAAANEPSKNELPIPKQTTDSVAGGSATQTTPGKLISSGQRPAVHAFPDTQPAATRIAAAYQNPISFYGKVVDESANAVAGANVRFRIATHPSNVEGTEHQTTSDSHGLFSLTGVFGAGLAVFVSKEGFHSTDRSKLILNFFEEKAHSRPPTALEPAIFVLKVKQQPEPIIHRRFRRFSIASDGTPVGVRFQAGSSSGAEVPHLHVQMWSAVDATNAQGQYNWSYKFSIPGGGLAHRKNPYEFQAPPEGYRDVVEGTMVAGGEGWHTSIQRDFFARLQNGCHVRFNVSLTTQGKGSFGIESFMNPAPGSRNLEFDSKMVEFPQSVPH